MLCSILHHSQSTHQAAMQAAGGRLGSHSILNLLAQPTAVLENRARRNTRGQMSPQTGKTPRCLWLSPRPDHTLFMGDQYIGLCCRVLQPYTNEELRDLRQHGDSDIGTDTAQGTQRSAGAAEGQAGERSGHEQVYVPGSGWVDSSETDLTGETSPVGCC